jgi:hypothetical protein
MTSHVYHVGQLSFDRKRNPTVDEKARAAWRDYEQGRALLVQRRISGSGISSRYEYIQVECRGR